MKACFLNFLREGSSTILPLRFIFDFPNQCFVCSQPGDVETAFQLVVDSGGLEQTRVLARRHCEDAITALDCITDSNYKQALVGLCEKVLLRVN